MCEVSFITNWKAFTEQWIWIISNKLHLNIKKKTKPKMKGGREDTEKERKKKENYKEWENKKEKNLLFYKSSM